MIELEQTLSRTEQTLTANPARHTPLRRTAQALSRRNIAAAKAHVLNSALERLTGLVFELERDDNNRLLAWNVDKRTGRILIGVPMGGRAHRDYGLRRSERDVLRRILVDVEASEGAPLYLYDGGKWYLNLYDYRERASANRWLKDNRITPQQWLHYLE